jgi:hypothetical protein
MQRIKLLFATSGDDRREESKEERGERGEFQTLLGLNLKGYPASYRLW